MHFHRFRLLPPRAQLLCVMVGGTYLAERSEGVTTLKLYHLPDEGRGFFAEVGPDEAWERLVVVQSFQDSQLLAPYTAGVQLPQG